MLPPTASMPTSPEPGTTSRPSSVNTFVCAPIVNFAVFGSEPGALIEPANPTPSLEPSESKQMMLPRCHERLLHLRSTTSRPS